jgi:hypothetical protein
MIARDPDRMAGAMDEGGGARRIPGRRSRIARMMVARRDRAE